MPLLVQTAPSESPVSLQEVKRHLRIPEADLCDDAYITDLIESATQVCQNWTARSFYTQTLKLVCDHFPVGSVIKLERATPLVSVTSLSYYDDDNNLQTVSASDYIVDTSTTPGRILLKSGNSWPTTRTEGSAVEIVYVAGSATVDAGIKQLIRATISHWFENREPVVVSAGISQVEIPYILKSLVLNHRVF